MFNVNAELNGIFESVFHSDPVLFAEAIINGHDYGSHEPFSIDSDVQHVYVDTHGDLVCVHSWDMEDFLDN